MAFQFSEKLKEDITDNTLIVDSLNLAFRWKHNGNHKNFKEEFAKTVESLGSSYRSKKIIICADHGASSYRRSLFPDYKADRKEKFKDQTDEERIKFEEFFTEFENTLNFLSDYHIVLRYKGVEADDIAAHLVKNKKEYNLKNIWLVSSDRDWDLLIQEGVNRFSYVTRKEITAENWFTHYDVSQEEYISLKCLQGDKGDNVPGISGIGPVRAKELIDKYGSALNIYDAIPIDSKYKHIQALNEQADQILINYELMDLLTYCDDAIGEENIRDIKAALGVDISW